MNNPKFYIHPLYFALLIFYIIIGKGAIFIAFMVVTLAHELAHARVANNLGYIMQRVALMPYGAVLYRLESLPNVASVKIAIAGPIMNLALAIGTLALWWVAPTTYVLTRPFLVANLAVCVINILPCYPLDGSRIIIGLSKNKLRTIKLTRIFSVILGLIMIGLGVASIWYYFNVTIIIMGIFLIGSAYLGGEKEEYEHVASGMFWVKDYAHGVVRKEVRISERATLYQTLKLLSRDSILELVIVSDNGTKKRISESELKLALDSHELNAKLVEIFV